MRLVLAALLLLVAPPALAQGFSVGDWGAVRIGERCHVFTTRAARDTSGALVFQFSPGGYDAAFYYEYSPWSPDEDMPWDEGDEAILELDGVETWLADEMWLEAWPAGGRGDMTAGFVGDTLAAFAGAQRDIGVLIRRNRLGENWLYGLFSTSGYREAMAAAGEMCGFDPYQLPQS